MYCGLSSGAFVKELAEDIGMPGVTGCFLQEVRQNPSQVDRGFAIERWTFLIQVRGSCDNLVHFGTDRPVSLYRLDQCVSISGSRRIVGSSSEPSQYPGVFGICHVVRQPQQGSTGSYGRNRGLSRRHPNDLSDKGVPLVLEKGEQRRSIVAGQPRRLLVTHNSSVTERPF